jgi:hypothetical protein
MAALGHAISGRPPRTGHAYSATLKTLRIPDLEHVHAHPLRFLFGSDKMLQ